MKKIVTSVIAFLVCVMAIAQVSTVTDRLTVREFLRLRTSTATHMDTGTLSYLPAHLFTANLAKPFMLDWYVSNDSVYRVTGNGNQFRFMLPSGGTTYVAGNGIKSLGVGSLQDGTIRWADSLDATTTTFKNSWFINLYDESDPNISSQLSMSRFGNNLTWGDVDQSSFVTVDGIETSIGFSGSGSYSKAGLFFRPENGELRILNGEQDGPGGPERSAGLLIQKPFSGGLGDSLFLIKAGKLVLSNTAHAHNIITPWKRPTPLSRNLNLIIDSTTGEVFTAPISTGVTAQGNTGDVQFKGSNGGLSARNIFTYDSAAGNLGVGIAAPTHRIHGVGSSFYFQGEGPAGGGIFRIVPGVANSSDIEWGAGTLRFNGAGGQSLNLQAPFLTINGSWGIGHGDLRLNTSGGTAMFISGSNNGRRVNIGSSEAVSSAQFQVDATNRGILTPRLTAAQRIAVSTPANGLLLYDTDSSRFFAYAASAWKGIRYTDEIAMSFPPAGIAVSTGSAWGTSITDNSANWNTAHTERLRWDGGATGLVAATGRTSLGATTVGGNLFTLANPSAVRFLRVNLDNTVDALDAAAFRTAIGAGTSSTVGTVTNFSFTNSTGITGTVTNAGTTPTLSLALTSAAVGLGNVTNESKATMFTNPTFTGTVTGVTKAHVGLSNVENTALSTWTGSSNITTLGTISTGTWNGTAIAANKAGVPTGGTAGQVLSKIDGTDYNTQWITPGGGGGPVTWGSITGTLSSQTDLQAALDAKAGLASRNTFTTTTGGLTIPRLTRTQRNAVSSPVDGEQIFNTDDKYFEYYDATFWGWMPVAEDIKWKQKYGFSEFTDLIHNLPASGTGNGWIGATGSGTGNNVTYGASTDLLRQGIAIPTTGSTATGRAGLAQANNISYLGNGRNIFYASVRPQTLSTVTERYQITVGHSDNATSVAATDGVYFLYDEGGVHAGSTASPNWQIVTSSNGTRTIANTGVAVSTTTFADLEIRINDNSTEARFYINGTEVTGSPITTNIPSGTARATNLNLQIYKTIGTTARTMWIDYVGYKQKFTNPRF